MALSTKRGRPKKKVVSVFLEEIPDEINAEEEETDTQEVNPKLCCHCKSSINEVRQKFNGLNFCSVECYNKVVR